MPRADTGKHKSSSHIMITSLFIFPPGPSIVSVTCRFSGCQNRVAFQTAEKWASHIKEQGRRLFSPKYPEAPGSTSSTELYCRERRGVSFRLGGRPALPSIHPDPSIQPSPRSVPLLHGPKYHHTKSCAHAASWPPQTDILTKHDGFPRQNLAVCKRDAPPRTHAHEMPQDRHCPSHQQL
jgi:hypothetical protein